MKTQTQNSSDIDNGLYEAIFIVSPGEEGWVVCDERHSITRFSSMARAIRWAAFAAQAAELKGRRATFRILESEIVLPQMPAAAPLAAVA